jgi:hypothetical protein
MVHLQKLMAHQLRNISLDRQSKGKIKEEEACTV